MAKIIIEAQIEEDEVLTDYSRTNAFFNEVTQLQQKYGVRCAISIEPFENTSFIDLMFDIDGDYEYNGFAGDLEDILEMHEVTYIYKSPAGGLKKD